MACLAASLMWSGVLKSGSPTLMLITSIPCAFISAWKRFGPDYIKKAYPSISDEQIDKIFHDVDYKLIRYIDANDNGIPLGDDEQPTLSKAVYMFNQSIGYIDPENFRLASSFLATVLHGYVTVSFRYIEAEQIVLQALKENCQKIGHLWISKVIMMILKLYILLKEENL